MSALWRWLTSLLQPSPPPGWYLCTTYVAEHGAVVYESDGVWWRCDAFGARRYATRDAAMLGR